MKKKALLVPVTLLASQVSLASEPTGSELRDISSQSSSLSESSSLGGLDAISKMLEDLLGGQSLDRTEKECEDCQSFNIDF